MTQGCPGEHEEVWDCGGCEQSAESFADAYYKEEAEIGGP